MNERKKEREGNLQNTNRTAFVPNGATHLKVKSKKRKERKIGRKKEMEEERKEIHTSPVIRSVTANTNDKTQGEGEVGGEGEG